MRVCGEGRHKKEHSFEGSESKWSADKFGDFPITSEDINNKYLKNNGDCIEPDNFIRWLHLMMMV